MYLRFLIGMLILVHGILDVSAQDTRKSYAPLAQAFINVDRDTEWKLVSEIEIGFDTYHPQGFALVDDHLFISSVEVRERTRRFPNPLGLIDRTVGAGIGHIFKTDLQGNLEAHVVIGKGDIYHPGGIDYDGSDLWIPVAEYRPNSRSIIYSMHPDSLIPRERFYMGDHIGGIVSNAIDTTLHVVSWGSRHFYSWPVQHTPMEIPDDVLPIRNPAHYIDYQDCQYAGGHTAICTGLSYYYQELTKTRFALGGIELIDLVHKTAIHQVPFAHWTEKGLPMTQNPVLLELDGSTLRLFAMPEDNQSRLFIFESIVNTKD